MSDAALELVDVDAGYGETVVLESVSFAVPPGSSVSIIGRNGVGKTTLLDTVMGHTTLHKGEIRLGSRDMTGLAVHTRVDAGLGYVPQEREIFPSLTVQENLEVAARGRGDWTVARVFEFFPNLDARRANRGNQLSGGEQQMLAIGRALMGNPSMLLMDEPSEGLAPVIVEQLQEAMVTLRNEGGFTMVLVEQNTRVALGFSERTIVLDRGRIVYDGASAELGADADKLAGLMGLN